MSVEIETNEEGKSFVPVPLNSILPDVVLNSDLYLKVDSKFLRYKNSGDLLEADKFDFFIQKELKNIYIAFDQFSQFMEWLQALHEAQVEEMVEEVGEDNRHLVEKREQIREKVYDTFTDFEMDSGIADILKDQVSEFIEEAKDLDLSKAVLAKLVKHNSSIADHALNTANVALFMAMVLGHGNKQVLEDIYFGALFHDYAKVKIPAKVLENKNNVKYNQAIQDHPKKSAGAVRKLDNMRDEVAKIAEQHHEQFNGNGYPKGLKEDEIFGLAMIVSMANVFDNVAVENKHKSKKERYRLAIKVIEYDKGKQFDPDMAEKVITALKLGFGEYYIPPASES